MALQRDLYNRISNGGASGPPPPPGTDRVKIGKRSYTARQPLSKYMYIQNISFIHNSVSSLHALNIMNKQTNKINREQIFTSAHARARGRGGGGGGGGNIMLGFLQ